MQAILDDVAPHLDSCVCGRLISVQSNVPLGELNEFPLHVMLAMMMCQAGHELVEDVILVIAQATRLATSVDEALMVEVLELLPWDH